MTVLLHFHRPDVERDIWVDASGRERLSDYWRLVCRDCDWKGTRVTHPSKAQSKDRVQEWIRHRKETTTTEDK